MAADAPSRFLDAGNEFRVGTERWWGDAIIGPDAIYLLQSAPARGRKYAALLENLADRVLPSRTLPAGPVTHIPDSVHNDPQWPSRQAGYSGVLIAPKEEVRFLYHQAGKLETRFIVKGVEVAIPHGRFGSKRVRSFAEAGGWPMFWDGVPVNLPERQLREEYASLPFGRPYISYSALTAGFLLGALPIALQFARNLDPNLVSTLWLAAWVGGVALILFGWVALRRGL